MQIMAPDADIAHKTIQHVSAPHFKSTNEHRFMGQRIWGIFYFAI